MTAKQHICASLWLVAMLGVNGAAGAQSGLGSERADLNNFRGDIWSVWASPASTRPRDLLTVSATLGAAALTSRIDSTAYIWLQTHDRTLLMQLVGPIRENARFPLYELGSGQGLLPVSLVLYAAGRLSHSANLRDAGLGCAAGHLASVGLRQVVMRSVGRARPKVTPHPFEMSLPGKSDWNWMSFYSGHISNSMACASFVGHRYSLGLLEPLPYMYSVAIGVGRLADGHHWASDMLVGGVVGFAVGKAIAERQLHRKLDREVVAGALPDRASWQIPVMQWSVVF